MEKWLDSNSTHPEITRTIIDTFLNTDSDKFQDHVPLEARAAIRQCAHMQDGLGIMGFHREHLVGTWGQLQHEHFTSTFCNSKRK